VRGLIVPAAILLALGATGGLALLALNDSPAPVPDAQSKPAIETADAAPAPDPPPSEVIRRYETTATLLEDLRDALAGDPKFLQAELLRVSEALGSRAAWTIRNVVPAEASPRVRALAVFAAGVHLQGEGILLEFGEERFPVVRKAAVLAMGYAPTGLIKAAILDGVEVPLGATVAPAEEGGLRRLYEAEKDPAVREAIEAVLRAAGLSRPR
jgi:hypothetical protein